MMPVKSLSSRKDASFFHRILKPLLNDRLRASTLTTELQDQCPTDPMLYQSYVIGVLNRCGLEAEGDGLHDLTKYLARGRLVTSGGYSDIYQATWRPEVFDGVLTFLPAVAVKVMRPVSSEDDSRYRKRKKQLKREVQVWQNLRHPHILPMIGIAYLGNDPQFPAMVTPWMERGTVIEYIKSHPGIAIEKFMLDLVNGLSYLHDYNPEVIHGDLKGSNVVVDRLGRLYICDFGLSRMTLDLSLWDTSATHPGGSIRWMAPELLSGEQNNATRASDIYAYSMTCYEMLSGNVPMSELKNDAAVSTAVVVRNERPSRELAQNVSDFVWRLMVQCWETDPGQRPQAHSLVRALHKNLYNGPPTSFELSRVIVASKSSEVRRLACSPSNPWVAILSRDQVSIRNLQTAKLVARPVTLKNLFLPCLAYSPGGAMIAIMGGRGISLLDGRSLTLIIGPLEDSLAACVVSFSSNGAWIAAGLRDGTIRLWDTFTGHPCGILQGADHRAAVECISASHCSRKLASIQRYEASKSIVLWDVTAASVMARLQRDDSATLETLSCSPREDTLAAAYWDGTITLWNTETFQSFRKISLHGDCIKSIAYSPDGRLIASGSNDRTVRVICVNTGKLIGKPLRGHRDYVRNVAFSWEGKKIASSSWDGNIRVWEAKW